jgi:hypothetical protein
MDLSYPIGKFDWKAPVVPESLPGLIDGIAATPGWLRNAVRGLGDEQLDTPYRPGGWTVRQLVHHVADSHANMYIRLRLALTEDEPLIKPYNQDKWAELADANTLPVDLSLQFLECMHARWVVLLRSLSAADFTRCYRHPEVGLLSLERATAGYAWHGQHHTAHITGLRERMGWK